MDRKKQCVSTVGKIGGVINYNYSMSYRPEAVSEKPS